MNAIALRDSDLALIRRTVAKECEPAEFDQFIHICRHVGLDPLRRQIYAFVFGKGSKKAADRKLTIVTGIDGYRTISARSGTYRPADRAPLIEYDEKLKSPANPLGIVRAEVTLYQFAHGSWHPVVGEAYWEEFCPTVYRPEDLVSVDTGRKYEDSGKPIIQKMPKDGAQPIVDPSKTGWVKGPRNQIAKCAEAAAHRRGWPNDFAGVMVEEEIDRMHTIDLTATEIVDKAEQRERMERIGGPALTVDWMDGNELQRVPVGQFYDRAMAYLKTCSGKPEDAKAFADRNRYILQEFWALDKAAALSLKKEIERIEAEKVVEIVVDEPKEKAAEPVPVKGGGAEKPTQGRRGDALPKLKLRDDIA